jgi:hypothetical protein
MRVRLTAKLAEVVNGIDLTHCEEGDIIEISEREARLLLAERWAEPVAEVEDVTCVPAGQPERAEAADEGVPVRSDQETRPGVQPEPPGTGVAFNTRSNFRRSI